MQAAAQRIQLQSQIPVQSISVSSLPNGQTLAHKPETKARPSGGQAAPNSGDVAALPACNIYSSEQCLQAQSFAHQTISQEAELQGNKTKPAASGKPQTFCHTFCLQHLYDASVHVPLILPSCYTECSMTSLQLSNFVVLHDYMSTSNRLFISI